MRFRCRAAGDGDSCRMSQLRSLLGLGVLIGLAWALSTDRRRVRIKTVVGGLLLQYVLAIFVLRTSLGVGLFRRLGELVAVVIQCVDKGAHFVFGDLTNPDGHWGFLFFTRALPTIIVFSSLSAIGYHFGILQRVVGGMAWVMSRALGTSGAESLAAAANVFLGQTEAPLFVRPYIPRMTLSELNALMVAGFATIAGSLIAVYADRLGHGDFAAISDMARHLLAASLISAVASLVVAKILVPETGVPETAGHVRLPLTRTTRNAIDAAASGAAEGLKLALNVAAMLIAFIALVALLDMFHGWVSGNTLLASVLRRVGIETLSLDRILGTLFYPVAWLIGTDAGDRSAFASLLGKAMALNEFIAYQSLGEMVTAGTLTPRSITLAAYALCGFANFSSIGIQIAGIGGLAPERNGDLASLGLRAMFGGAIACWMTACVAGTLI